jgi:SAM-dependent methyltransferase
VPRTKAFDDHLDRYEAWFTRHELAYLSELQVVREMLPPGRALEVGVGSGRFAVPLGISTGVEPSAAMRRLARERGVDAVDGVAEDLPYLDGTFDTVLIVTTICFLDDVPQSLREAYRVLRPEGHLVIGFIDRDSLLGQDYDAHREESVFYREATFVSTVELAAAIRAAGFRDLRFRQTVFSPLREVTAVQSSRPGHGVGAFVVVRGQRPAERAEPGPPALPL